MDDLRMAEALGNLSGKMDAVLARLSSMHKDHVEVEARVRLLENARARLLGMAALLATAASAGLTWAFRRLEP